MKKILFIAIAVLSAQMSMAQVQYGYRSVAVPDPEHNTYQYQCPSAGANCGHSGPSTQQMRPTILSFESDVTSGNGNGFFSGNNNWQYLFGSVVDQSLLDEIHNNQVKWVIESGTDNSTHYLCVPVSAGEPYGDNIFIDFIDDGN
ncbi:MAG: hypothetical protein ACTHJ0_00930 [Flavipsychrobacter sp.]